MEGTKGRRMDQLELETRKGRGKDEDGRRLTVSVLVVGGYEPSRDGSLDDGEDNEDSVGDWREGRMDGKREERERERGQMKKEGGRKWESTTRERWNVLG